MDSREVELEKLQKSLQLWKCWNILQEHDMENPKQTEWVLERDPARFVKGQANVWNWTNQNGREPTVTSRTANQQPPIE